MSNTRLDSDDGFSEDGSVDGSFQPSPTRSPTPATSLYTSGSPSGLSQDRIKVEPGGPPPRAEPNFNYITCSAASKSISGIGKEEQKCTPWTIPKDGASKPDSIDRDHWQAMSIKRQRVLAHVGRIEDSSAATVALVPCRECVEAGEDDSCMVYTMRSRQKYHGGNLWGFSCSRCRKRNTKCSHQRSPKRQQTYSTSATSQVDPALEQRSPSPDLQPTHDMDTSHSTTTTALSAQSSVNESITDVTRPSIESDECLLAIRNPINELINELRRLYSKYEPHNLKYFENLDGGKPSGAPLNVEEW